MMTVLTWLFSFAGFWLLCIVTARHRKRFNLRPLSQKAERCYKVAGFILLTFALFCVNLMPNAIDGLLIWFGVLTFSSLFAAGILAVQQQRKSKA